MEENNSSRIAFEDVRRIVEAMVSNGITVHYCGGPTSGPKRRLSPMEVVGVICASYSLEEEGLRKFLNVNSEDRIREYAKEGICR